MIGVCTKCGGMYETTTEDADAPGRLCAPCHWSIEAVKLLDAHGPWPGGREWWARIGIPDPPLRLLEALKIEQLHRLTQSDRIAGKTGEAAVLHFNFKPDPKPGASD